ncbi:MAG: glycosyltransferase [Thermoleophilia bacterium]|nr:glycosyltransferase [Thermoleophilia bacterium]
MRIVQLSTSDLQGGAEKTAWKLHRAFRERGHESLLVVGRKLSADPNVIEIDASRRGRGLRGRLTRRLEWALGLQYLDHPGSHRVPEAVGELDVVHAHNLHGGYFDLAALRRLSTLAPTILTLHDMWLITGHCAHAFGCERWRRGCGACPDLTIYPALTRDGTRANLRRKQRLLQDADLVVASPAEWLLELVAASYLATKPRRRIPNPVDTRVFAPGDRRAARAALGLPVDRPVVLLPARDAVTSHFKDFVLFERSIEALGDPPPLALTFDGGERGAPGRVTFVRGSFDEEQVARFYRAADVVAVPSRAETLPLTILEAFASAVPVVATRVGGVPELVRDGENGLLVEPGDVDGFAAALRRLLGEPATATRLGAAGLEQVRADHDLGRVAGLWLDWYAELGEAFARRQRGGRRAASS